MQISGTALVLDEIINHVQFLQRQVEVRVSSFLLFFWFWGKDVAFDRWMCPLLRNRNVL
jgi:hypothetical protein